MAVRLVSSDGDDVNNGLVQAVRTIGRAHELCSPGDTIALRAGNTFTETLKMTKPNLKFETYGGSQKAIWTGFMPLSAWVNRGDGTWETSLLSPVSCITVDGIQVHKGRYPKLDADNGGYLTVSSAGPNTISNNALGAFNLTGSEVAIRTTSWTLENAKITSQSGNTINFGAGMSYPPQNNYGFFLQNNEAFLQEFGDWMYEESTKKIIMYFGNDLPSRYTIKASVPEMLLYQHYGLNDFFLKDIEFSGCNYNAIWPYGGTVFNMDNLTFKNLGGYAVRAENHSYIEITNSEFLKLNNSGLDLRNNTNNSLIENNFFSEMGYWPGAYINGVGQASAISTAGAGTRILKNRIEKTGYIGIRFEGSNSKCSQNYIREFCRYLSDGSAIYSRNTAKTVNTGMECNWNIVTLSAGTGAGTPYQGQQEGIYLDDWSRGIVVERNSISRIKGKGIFLHNCKDIDISTNTVFDCNFSLYSQSDTDPRTTGIKVKGNVFVTRNPSQKMVSLHTNVNDLEQFSTAADFDNNRYFAANGPAGENFRTQSGGAAVNRNFAGWKSAFGFDLNSTLTALDLTDESQYKYIENPADVSLVADLSDARYQDASGAVLGSSEIIPPYGSLFAIKIAEAFPLGTYYVSDLGNDANDGLSQSTPFKTHTKAQSVAIPGDIILTKRGSKFAPFNFTKAGEPNHPIQFDVYGNPNDPLPVISGYKTLTGWISLGNNLWKVTDQGFPDRLNFLQVNTEINTVAQWPKHRAYHQMTAVMNIPDPVDQKLGRTGVITDSVNLAGKNFSGGEIVIKKNPWVLDRCTITSHSNNEIGFSGGSSDYPAQKDWGYFIQNHRSCLTENFDWCQEGKDVVMYCTVNPALHQIKAPYHSQIRFNGAKHNLLFNHRIEGLNGGTTTTGYDPALFINNSTGLQIAVCQIEDIGNTLVILEATNNSGFTLLGNKIRNCLNIGFWNRHSTTSPTFTIESNSFENIGHIRGAGGNRETAYSLIVFAGSVTKGIVKNNRAKNVGYNGVRFAGFEFLIEGNVVENAGMVKDDGACFYSYGNGDLDKTYSKLRRIVKNNVALNSLGTNEGKPSWFAGTDLPYATVEGYYLDDDTNELTLTDNVAINCRYGLKFHNNQQITALRNSFINNQRAQVLFSNDNLGQFSNKNITFRENLLFSMEADQMLMFITTKDAADGKPTDAGLIGSMDRNKYFAPYHTSGGIRVQKTDGNNNTVDLTLAQWKASGYGHDANSVGAPVYLAGKEVVLLNDTADNKTVTMGTVWQDHEGVSHDLSGTWVTEENTVITDDIILLPYQAKVILKKGNAPAPPSSFTVGIIPSENGAVFGAGTYPAGSTVSLEAVPLWGYRFVSWSDNTTANPYVFPAANVQLKANFAPVEAKPPITARGRIIILKGGSFNDDFSDDFDNK